jgi:hypothetical protein
MGDSHSGSCKRHRGRTLTGTYIRSADAAALVKVAARLRPLQCGAPWEELLSVAAGIVALLIRKTPEERTLTYDAPGESTILVPLSQTVATLHVHGCLYLIESPAHWTVLAPCGIWSYPPRLIVTLLSVPGRADGEMRLH